MSNIKEMIQQNCFHEEKKYLDYELFLVPNHHLSSDEFCIVFSCRHFLANAELCMNPVSHNNKFSFGLERKSNN